MISEKQRIRSSNIFGKAGQIMIRISESTVSYENWKQEKWEDKLTCFRLDNGTMTYAMAVNEDGYLMHLHFGKTLGDDDLSYLLNLTESPFTPKGFKREQGTFMDSKPFEYPCHGLGDYREPCMMILDDEGMSTVDLRYRSYRIEEGKPQIRQKGYDCFPQTFGGKDEAETLVIVMEDETCDLTVELYYTIFKNSNVLTRSARAVNHGYSDVRILRMLSTCVDFPSSEYDMITLNGSWARERIVERAPLHHGKQSVDSARGESSHQANPFVALVSHKADERTGEAFGFNLVYSGNFLAEAEVTQHKKTRFVMGINPFDFSWLLRSEEEFQTPEAVMVYSDSGIGNMSRTFHDLYRNHLIRGAFKDRERPVLINNWEATYFNFDTEKILSIAREASKLGVEMLVLDDGWFGHRDSDNSSLGDWFVYEKKLAGGLPKLVEEVNKLGMKFGLWFEPEMISPDSELYREHPEWAIQIIGRPMTQSREQYVLDFSNAEVRDYIYGMMKKLLDSANIEYIKWDMNRQLTEVGSTSLPRKRQRELWHRYVLGVYDLMNRLTTDYPGLLLENCSGGGARFDPGMLYFSPQIWTSDDTDAIERLKIQYGTSLCYPVSSMGAHVSDCPNHTVGRNTPFETRGNVALVGTFGYELDVTKIPENDRNQIPGQIEKFHRFNPLIRTGDQYRLGNLFENPDYDAWMFVAKDKSEALFTYVQVLGKPNALTGFIKLDGLVPEKRYRIEETGQVLTGQTLMELGVPMKLWGDFASRTLYLKAVEE